MTTPSATPSWVHLAGYGSHIFELSWYLHRQLFTTCPVESGWRGGLLFLCCDNLYEHLVFYLLFYLFIFQFALHSLQPRTQPATKCFARIELILRREKRANYGNIVQQHYSYLATIPTGITNTVSAYREINRVFCDRPPLIWKIK